MSHATYLAVSLGAPGYLLSRSIYFLTEQSNFSSASLNHAAEPSSLNPSCMYRTMSTGPTIQLMWDSISGSGGSDYSRRRARLGKCSRAVKEALDNARIFIEVERENDRI